MWIKPLQVSAGSNDGRLTLLAPNKFIVDWVCVKYLAKIEDIMAEVHEGVLPSIDVKVGDARDPVNSSPHIPVSKPVIKRSDTPKTISEVVATVCWTDEGETSGRAAV